MPLILYYEINGVVFLKKGFLMKKQILLIGVLCLGASGLHGATVDEIARELSSAASTFGVNALNKNVSTAQQNAPLITWDKAFAQAKTFILENSKDLLRKQDPILVDAMSKVEKVNMDFINLIKIIRNTLPTAPVSKLLIISGEAKKSVDKLYTTSFTLPGKKDASALLKSVARFIENTSKELYDMLIAR